MEHNNWITIDVTCSDYDSCYTLTSDGIFACNSSDRMFRSVVDLITLIRYFTLMIDRYLGSIQGTSSSPIDMILFPQS